MKRCTRRDFLRLSGAAAGAVLTGPMARLIQDRIKRALAAELLFGRLEKGGAVRVGLDADGDTLSFDITAA